MLQRFADAVREMLKCGFLRVRCVWVRSMTVPAVR